MTEDRVLAERAISVIVDHAHCAASHRYGGKQRCEQRYPADKSECVECWRAYLSDGRHASRYAIRP